MSGKLRIGIDGRDLLVAQRTGVERVVHHFLDSLSRVGDPSHEYVVFFHEDPPEDGMPQLPGPAVVEPIRFPRLQKLGDAWIVLQMRRLIKEHRLDAVYTPNTKLPFTRTPRVTTVHGLEWHYCRDDYPRRELIKQRLWFSLASRWSTGLVTFTNRTRDDIRGLRPRCRVPMCVVPEGVDAHFHRLTSDERSTDALARLGVRRPFVLSVCSLEPRKNLDALIRAFAMVVRETDVPHELVLVGRAGRTSDRVREMIDRTGLGDRVCVPGYVSDDDLVQLYDRTDLFVYPSKYEGFGLPVIEAMACGAPVVTSHTGALGEVAGEAALLVDPMDDRSIADGIAAVLGDESRRSDMRAAGLRRAAEFSWDEMARTIVRFIDDRVRAASDHGASAPLTTVTDGSVEGSVRWLMTTVTNTQPEQMIARQSRPIDRPAPRRVCLVSSNLHAVPSSTYGAVEVQMMEQARGLASLGHEVHIITVGRDRPDDDGRGDSIVFHRIGRAFEDEGPAGLAALVTEQLRFGMRAKRLVRELDPEIVHYHARYPCLLAVAGPRPLTDRYAVLYHAHTWKRAAGMSYPAFSLRRAAFTVGSYFDKLVAERSHHVVAISDFVRERILHSTAAPPDQVTVVTNVVDHEIFHPHPMTRDPNEILYVGRVAEEKGVDLLIGALPELISRRPGAILTIVGPKTDGTERGSYLGKCQALVEDLGLTEHVRFAGMVPNDELPPLLSRSRVLVLPSLWEGLGVVVIEALACGLPVVGSDVGGIPELIEDGRTGRLVPPSDVDAWAEAIIDVMEDDDLARVTAEAGPELVTRRHSRHAVRQQLADVYERALTVSPAASRAGSRTGAGSSSSDAAAPRTGAPRPVAPSSGDALLAPSAARSDGRLRVLLLLTSTAGGAGYQNYLLAKRLDREEFDVTVAYGPGYPLDAAFAELDVPCIELSMSRHLAPIANARAYVEIRRLLRDGAFDVVCTSCSIAGLLGRVAARGARVPVVHVIHVYASQPHQHPIKRSVYRWIERWLDARTARYIAVSNAAKAYGVETGIMSADKVDVVFNAIDRLDRPRRSPEKVRRDLGVRPDSRLIGTVGRLERQKGLPHLLEAAAIIKSKRSDVELLIVGDGPLQTELETLARNLGVDDIVRFTGWRDDVPDILGTLDIFCLASLWETFGLVLAEAMDAGLPIVATNVDGIPEVVVDGQTGVLVPPGDADALAEALERLLADPDTARQLGDAGTERLVSTFSVETMVQGYQQVIGDVARAQVSLESADAAR